jgi:hypothetical protein
MTQSFGVLAWSVFATFAVMLTVCSYSIPGPISRLATVILLALAIILGIMSYYLTGPVGLLSTALFLAVVILWGLYFALYFMNKDVDAADPASPNHVGNS